MHNMSCRFLAVIAGAFSIGLFAGLILPPVWLVIAEGILLALVAFCILFC